MHRQFVVAIETKIGDRDDMEFRPMFGDGEAHIIVTLGTETGAVFRHRKWLFCHPVSNAYADPLSSKKRKNYGVFSTSCDPPSDCRKYCPMVAFLVPL
jgi:hypothetical protein